MGQLLDMQLSQHDILHDCVGNATAPIMDHKDRGRQKIMSAVELLCHIVGMNSAIFTKAENLFLEAELFTRICEQLREFFRKQHKEYFRLMKFTFNKEAQLLKYILYI
jgi:hypothetical protein